MTRALWITLPALLCCACIELPDFARPSRVTGPRVLALVAQPPEANPGQDVALSLLVAGARDFSVSWRACGAFDAFGGGGMQYGDEELDEGCGASPAIELGEGPTALLPGAISERLFRDLETAQTILGNALPEGTIERVRESVGLPLVVEANVDAEGRHIRVVKRVLISERATPHTNPPPPRFALGDLAIAARDDVAFTCAAEDGGPVRVAARRSVELAPEVGGDGELEPWLERYAVLDLRGELQERDETAFYSWFSSGGELQEETTKSPLRNEIWRTPDTGCHPLWLVVRDGHGGTSACGVTVAVGGESCD